MPALAEYWHMGETAIRLGRVSWRRVNGWKSCVMKTSTAWDAFMDIHQYRLFRRVCPVEAALGGESVTRCCRVAELGLAGLVSRGKANSCVFK
jgi:hypothetical protein